MSNPVISYNGPISGDLQNELHRLDEVLQAAPDELIPPLRHCISSLFDILERVSGLEEVALVSGEDTLGVADGRRGGQMEQPGRAESGLAGSACVAAAGAEE